MNAQVTGAKGHKNMVMKNGGRVRIYKGQGTTG